MKNRIFPTIVYPIGELPNGTRLCASVGRTGFKYFPEFRSFDVDDSDPWVITITDDDVPTLKDEDIQALVGDDDWFLN